jgi:hypothetical protein
MACKFFAKNGNPSILYDDLATKYNDNTAEVTWLKTRTDEFNTMFPNAILDTNGEPTISFLENMNQVLVSTETSIPDFYTVENDVQQQKLNKVKSAFIDAGVDIVFEQNDNLESSGKVMTKNNRLVIQVSPSKMKDDSYFHEGGHILVDMIGEDSELIQTGINHLRNTKLWNDVALIYPELTGNKLGKEVLTTAIGIEANKLFNEEQQMGRWKIWLRSMLNKFKDLLNIEVDVAERLALQLVNGKIKEQLDTKVAIETQYQRDLKIVNSVFQTKKDLLEKASNVIKKKLAIYYSDLSDEEKLSNPSYTKFKELETLFNELQPSEINNDIVKFLELIYDQTGLLEKRIDQVVNPTAKDIQDGNDKVTFKFLNTLIQYNETFSIIEDLVDIMEQDAELKALVDVASVNFVNNIYGRFTKVKRSAKRVTIKMLADYYLSLPGKSKLELAKREEIEREYNERFKDKRQDKNFKENRKNYVDAKIKEIRPELHRAELQRYENLLEQSDHDISWMSRMFLDGDTIDDELINIVSEVLDKAEFDTMNSVNNEYKKLIKIVENFEKTNNNDNQQKKYDALIEDEVGLEGNKTGKKTNKLISKYYSGFYKARNESWKVYNELLAKQERGEPVEDNELTDAMNRAKNWNKQNTINIGDFENPIYVPNKRWENPQWLEIENNTEAKQLFNYLTQRIDEDDKILPEWAKLGRDSFGVMQYRLPAITKSKLESVYDGSLMNNVKERYKAFKEGRKQDDTSFGTDFGDPNEMTEAVTGEPIGSIRETINRYTKVLVNEVGQEKRRVPIYYRYRLDTADQSFDLPTLVLLNHHMSKNYENKLEIMPQTELTLDLVKSREVPGSVGTGFSGIKYKIDRILGNDVEQIPVVKTGEDSNAAKAMESLIEDRLYGIASASGVTATRVARMLAGYTGNVTLIGNYLSAGANLAFGTVAEWMESIGGIYFNKKNLANAHLKYTTELANGQLLNDFGKRAIKSRTSLLIEKFDALSDWSAVAREFMKDKRYKALMGSHTLHFMNGGAEHMMQSILMYAILDGIKVQDNNGNYLTVDGTTTDITKAMSIDEAYKATDTGLVLDPRVSNIVMPSGKVEYDGNQGDTEFLVSRLIKDLNSELHGQYSGQKRSEIQRYWYGTLIMLLRKWLPRGVVRRWRGIETAGVPTDQLLLSDKFYSRPGQMRREGYYTTTTRFMWNLMKQGKQFKWEMVTVDWSKLTDYERANIKKTAFEFAMMVALLGLATAMKKLADEEEDEKAKKMWYLIAFYSHRLYGETNAFINPNQALNIIKNPSAALTMVSRAIALLYQLTTSPFEEYEQGDRKGQLKLRKKTEDLVPLFKQLDRNVEDVVSFMFNARVI